MTCRVRERSPALSEELRQQQGSLFSRSRVATAPLSAKLVRDGVQQGRQGLATFKISPLDGEKAFPAEKQENAGYAVPQLTTLPQRERKRIPSWYASEFGCSGYLASEAKQGQQQKVTIGSAGNLASKAELDQTQKVTLGCVGSSGESERDLPLLSSEAESSVSADVGGVRLASSVESRGTVPKLGTRARVTGEAGEKKRVRFALSPRIIPNTWFQLLSEGVRFP